MEGLFSNPNLTSVIVSFRLAYGLKKIKENIGDLLKE